MELGTRKRKTKRYNDDSEEEKDLTLDMEWSADQVSPVKVPDDETHEPREYSTVTNPFLQQ